MKSLRSTVIVALGAAVLGLGAIQSDHDAASSLERMRYEDSGLAKPHGGIRGIRVDAFSYRPYAGGAPLDLTAATATFEVNYTGFTPQAQAAFQFAVNIWANTVSSPIPIVIDASFTDLPGATLGRAGPFLSRNFPNAPVLNTWFPDPIADRLAGSDVFPGADIEAEFDSGAPWYFGLDAHPPSGTYDFVSVVLHELGHGLGFIGSGEVSGGTGSWGLDGSAVIYDRYVRASGTPIISIASPSATLAAALTSNNLFFVSPPTTADGSGPAISAPAKLYAPATFEDGSSFSHLDEATYPPGNPNSLMTPFIASAEANHNPGSITGEIFSDIGWGSVGGGGVPGQPTVTSAVASAGVLTVSWTSGAGGAATGHSLQFFAGGTHVATIIVGAGNSTNITLPPGVVGTFQVRVTATNGSGASPPSALFTFTIGGGAPGQPTVTSANASGGVLTVSWVSGAGATATAHRLDFFSGPVLVASLTVGAGTSQAIPIPPGTQGSFSVSVTALNGAIAGPPSALFAFTIGPSCTVPASPVVSGGVAGGTASVSWPAVAGATAYIVSAGTTQGGSQYLSATDIGAITGIGASGLPPGFQAWVRVIAVNACAQESAPTDFLVQ